MAPRRNTSKLEAFRRSFVWSEFENWKPEIIQLLGDLLNRKVLKALRESPPEYFVDDDLEWLNEAIAYAHDYPSPPFPDVWETLIDKFAQCYQFVHAYHGCRPVSLDTYKRDGILPSNPKALQELAFSLFPDKERVKAAINELAKEGEDSYEFQNQGKIYFCLDYEELVEHCGHYLLNGSEYLLCIAVRAGGVSALRERGRATVIESRIPVEDIPREYLKCLCGHILREICQRHCVKGYQCGALIFGFHITCPLKPENIVGFLHPTGIPNPHKFNCRED